jgi:DNA repair exonuclease SbcCD ATPase subunit
MIDKKINDTLIELEENLKSLDSARLQVTKIVESYDGLKTSTSKYVSELETITEKMKNLINSIEKDYSQKNEEFQKDRDVIYNTSSAAIKELSDATGEFKSLLRGIQDKLKYNIIINVISLIVIILIAIIVLM